MVSAVAAVLLLVGGALAALAGVGVLRFATPYARFHAAGKASPIAFILVAAGASIELGPGAGARLAVAAAGLILTMPVGVHLLFRAVHRTDPPGRPEVDELAGNDPGPADPEPGPGRPRATGGADGS